ncbi:MAG: response regulator [Deltaproteobacteria bacterium]|nr:response regulator [Deltaproteobacteria bacterium]MCL5791618.1 response regulator [Deltaproteobacteria bacterium]
MGKKILLADDSITIQKVISITFAPPTYDITIVDNGNDAIKKVSEIKPDVVLTDIVMPGKNGYEVCEAVKSNTELQHIPVLLLTGAFEAFDEQKAKQVGADAWLSKPFETQSLIDKVNILFSKPAVKKPIEAKPATAPAQPSKPGVPPPPPPRKPAVPHPAPAKEEINEPVEEIMEPETFSASEETIGAESEWETIPLSEDNTGPNKQEIEEFPEEELKPLEGPAIGFDELEEAITESEEKTEMEVLPAAEHYEKTYEDQELINSEEITGTQKTKAIQLSREDVTKIASEQIEKLLQDILPDTVKQAVGAKVEAIIRDVAEKIIWEVVPTLTETMIKEEIQRLKAAKKKA